LLAETVVVVDAECWSNRPITAASTERAESQLFAFHCISGPRLSNETYKP